MFYRCQLSESFEGDPELDFFDSKFVLEDF